MKIIIIALTICNISFFLFGMEEEKPIKIWNYEDIRIFFPDIGYKKNQDKKYIIFKGSLFKEQDYYAIETFIGDQRFKSHLQLNDYQKEFVEKNEHTMTILLKDVKGNIQIDIETINGKECKKPEVSDKIDEYILSVDERFALGEEGDIPKYLNILMLYSNKIYPGERGYHNMNIYKQNYYNVIETFGEGNKIYRLPFSLEMIMKLEERNHAFYLHLNEKTDKGDNLKALIRIAQINDKILSMNQKKQEEKYLENDHYDQVNDVLSDRTDSEKIQYIESLVYDIYLYLKKENIQGVERGEYPSDSRSDQEVTNNQEVMAELKKYTNTMIENFKTYTENITDLKRLTENIVKENEQLKTQLNTMQTQFSTITNQNNKILKRMHYMMCGVSFWIIVLLIYTYKNHKTLIFT